MKFALATDHDGVTGQYFDKSSNAESSQYRVSMSKTNGKPSNIRLNNWSLLRTKWSLGMMATESLQRTLVQPSRGSQVKVIFCFVRSLKYSFAQRFRELELLARRTRGVVSEESPQIDRI